VKPLDWRETYPSGIPRGSQVLLIWLFLTRILLFQDHKRAGIGGDLTETSSRRNRPSSGSGLPGESGAMFFGSDQATLDAVGRAAGIMAWKRKSFAANARTVQIESSGMTQGKSSGKLTLPDNCRDVTSDKVGMVFGVVGGTSSPPPTEVEDAERAEEILAWQKHRQSQRRPVQVPTPSKDSPLGPPGEADRGVPHLRSNKSDVRHRR
jgi:hypothetical protein